MSEDRQTKLVRTLNRVCKWRGVFTGWQLGTRSMDDPEAQAVRDQRDLLIMLRIECSAMAVLMMEKGVFTVEEWQTKLIEEAGALDEMYERKFPGMKSTDEGIVYDKRAIETMKGWRP